MLRRERPNNRKFLIIVNGATLMKSQIFRAQKMEKTWTWGIKRNF